MAYLGVTHKVKTSTSPQTIGNVHRRCAVDGENWIMAASRPQPLIAGRLSLVETLLELFLKYFHCPIRVRHGATSRCSINRLTLPNRTLRAVEKWSTEVGLADKSVEGRRRLRVRLGEWLNRRNASEPN